MLEISSDSQNFKLYSTLQYYILYHYLKFRFRINSIQGKMAIGRFAVKNNTLFSICFAHNWGEVFYFQSIYILCSLFTFVYHYSPRISYINTVSYNRIQGLYTNTASVQNILQGCYQEFKNWTFSFSNFLCFKEGTRLTDNTGTCLVKKTLSCLLSKYNILNSFLKKFFSVKSRTWIDNLLLLSGHIQG